MSNGINIISPSGIAAIDGDFKNYRVWFSGSIGSPGSISFPVQSVMPLIFVRPNTYGGNFSLDYASITWNSGGNTSVFLKFAGSYVVAIPMDGASADTNGIRVFNSSGTVVFDSGHSYINIDSVVLKTPTSNPGVYSYYQPIALTPPPFGVRYFLINMISTLDTIYSYSDDGCGGCGGSTVDYYSIFNLYGKFDSETQVSYRIQVIDNVGFAAYGGLGIQNPSIPLVSAYINL